MKNLFLVLLLIISVSCKREDDQGFIWEKTGGSGQANYTLITSDSLYLVAGTINGEVTAIKAGRSGKTVFNFSPGLSGTFTSALEDTSGYYLAGSSGGDLLVTRLNSEGEEVWTFTEGATCEVLNAVILKTGDTGFLAIGSDHPDSTRYGSYLMVYFDRDGSTTNIYQPSPGYKISVGDAAVGPAGELYLAVTKLLTGDKTKASVARVTGTGAKIWETELYNNPSFGAASIEIDAGDGGELYVTGMTELNFDDQLLMNSWIAALSSGGNVLWKDYLENSNSGEEVAFDGFSGLLVMNMNCGTINYISLPDGMITDRIRVYDVCDPYDTGALLRSMAVNPQGDYFMAGARSGNFYYALRKGIVYDNQQ